MQLLSLFVPFEDEISIAINQDIYDLIICPNKYFLTFNPNTY